MAPSASSLSLPFSKKRIKSEVEGNLAKVNSQFSASSTPSTFSGAMEDGEVDEKSDNNSEPDTILGSDLDAYCVLLDDDADMWLPEAELRTLKAGGVLVGCTTEEKRPRIMLRARPSSSSATFTTGEGAGHDFSYFSAMTSTNDDRHVPGCDQILAKAKQKCALAHCLHQVLLKVSEVGARNVALFVPTYNLNVGLLSPVEIQRVAVQVAVKTASMPEGRKFLLNEIILCLDEVGIALPPGDSSPPSSPSPNIDALAMELACTVAQVSSSTQREDGCNKYYAELVERALPLSLLTRRASSTPTKGTSTPKGDNQEFKSHNDYPCFFSSEHKGQSPCYFPPGMSTPPTLFSYGATRDSRKTEDDISSISEREGCKLIVTEDPSKQEEHLLSLMEKCKSYAMEEYDRVTKLVAKQQEALESSEGQEDSVGPSAITSQALFRIGLRALTAVDIKKDIRPRKIALPAYDGGGLGGTAALSTIGVKKKHAPTRNLSMSPLAAAAAEPERSHFIIRGLPARIANCLNELRCLVLATPAS